MQKVSRNVVSNHFCRDWFFIFIPMILTYAHSCNELDCKFRDFTVNKKWFQNIASKCQRYHSGGCRARRNAYLG